MCMRTHPFTIAPPYTYISTHACKVAGLGKRVKDMESDVKQRTKLQAAKDTAQDEMWEMELKQLGRQIEAKLSRAEVLDMTAAQNQKLKSLETAFLGVIDEKAESLHQKLYGELEKVLQQLYTIQQASEKGRSIVDDRVKQCAADQAALQRELQLQRRNKEELQGQCKRLAERLVQVEANHMEQAVRHEEQLKSLEKRCNHYLVAEVANRQKDLKAMAKALRDDLLAHVDAAQHARGGLKAELVAHLEDKMDQGRRDLDQAVSEWNATHKQGLAALESAFRRDLAAQLEATQSDVGARCKALADAQGATESKVFAMCKHNTERTAMFYEELVASLCHGKQVLLEQLETKTGALQHELQDHHMQLSQRLSVAVQRLALCEVKAGERHERLKSALTEVALKLVPPEAAAALGKHPSMEDLLVQLNLHRDATARSLLRLENQTSGLVETQRQMQGTVQSLATRDNHWTVLEARLQEHSEALVHHCLATTVSSSSSSSSASSSSPSSSPVTLTMKKEAKDMIATHSYRVAKTIALKADYEVIRRSVERKEPMTDEECDASLLQLRETYLKRFLDTVAVGVNKALQQHQHHQSTFEDMRVVAVALEGPLQFQAKLEQAIRLALSKFSRIHVGRTLFGKINLETQPACLACNRQFVDHPGTFLFSSF